MKIALPIIIIFILLVGYLVMQNIQRQNSAHKITFGVTFSDKYARELGLDPDEVLEQTLTDLKVKNFRLPVYWDQIEKFPGKYDFKSIDKYLKKIADNQGEVILVVGLKQPRWPECHGALWVEDLNTQERQEAQLRMVKDVVERYKDNPEVYAIQVENEPFMAFGVCPPLEREFLAKEVELVKSLTKKPIVISDSGEVRPWISPMKLSDILGISVYRRVYNPKTGYLNYPLPPFYYQAKSYLVRNLFAKNNQKTIITELQAEPWTQKPLRELSAEEQALAFPAKTLEENILYSKKIGFDTIQLWGVEWWYFMKEKGNLDYWEIAKKAFSNP